MTQSIIELPQGPPGDQGPPGGAFAWKTYSWDSDQLETPNNADWSESTPAAGEEDANNNAIIVRAFDDSDTEGVGFSLFVPNGATSMILKVKHRGGGTSGTVVWALKYRQIPDNAAVGSWSSFSLDNLSLPANSNYQYDQQELKRPCTCNNLYQFEIIRDGTVGGDTLSGDWYLANLEVEVKWEFVNRFFAAGLRSPDNADWAVNALAAIAADSNNNAISVRRFDDTTEEGVGFSIYVPDWAVNMTLGIISRAETAPGGAAGVVVDLYERSIGDNVAIGTWTNGGTLTIAIPTNEYFQYDSLTDTIANWSLAVGTWHQFELTRDTDDVSDDLTGDWTLLEVSIKFT